MQIKLRKNFNVRIARANNLRNQVSKYPCRFQDFVIPPTPTDPYHYNLIRLDGESN